MRSHPQLLRRSWSWQFVAALACVASVACDSTAIPTGVRDGDNEVEQLRSPDEVISSIDAQLRMARSSWFSLSPTSDKQLLAFRQRVVGSSAELRRRFGASPFGEDSIAFAECEGGGTDDTAGCDGNDGGGDGSGGGDGGGTGGDDGTPTGPDDTGEVIGFNKPLVSERKLELTTWYTLYGLNHYLAHNASWAASVYVSGSSSPNRYSGLLPDRTSGLLAAGDRRLYSGRYSLGYTFSAFDVVTVATRSIHYGWTDDERYAGEPKVVDGGGIYPEGTQPPPPSENPGADQGNCTVGMFAYEYSLNGITWWIGDPFPAKVCTAAQ
jgi:hypothetical protein